jgi:stearoyl-CoA desaturase (delta-9 desaturase)
MASWRDRESEKQARSREENESRARRCGIGTIHDEGVSPFRCECGDAACTCAIRLTAAEYESVRAYATRFAIARNHENPESEQLVEEHQRFAVVETVSAEAAKLARRSNPRQWRGQRRSVPEMVAIEHQTLDRVVRTIVFLAPPAALALGGWLAWGGALKPLDLLVLAIFYTLTGLGITVGYHRLFTHRSFKTTRIVRALLAVLGSMAVEGPLIEWVATHRKHHRFSDQPGDPHSPHVDDAPGWRGALRGLGHAHVGWMLRGKEMANPARYAKDLLADPDLCFISRTFPLWVMVGLALPFAVGLGLTGSIAGGLTSLLWAGAVRVFLLHHATFSINSLCHYFGRRPFSTHDQSRNLAWLAPLAFGEAWHNNHHAFPTSASHGFSRWQLDPGAWLIATLERCHLAWDVVRIAPERQQTRAVRNPQLTTPRLETNR